MAEHAVTHVGLAAPAAPSPRVPDFEELFEKEAGYVWSTLRHMGVQPSDLEDLTHDVLLAVFRRLGDFDATREVRPWLFGIALRVVSHYRRRAHRRLEVPVAIVDEVEGSVDSSIAPDERAALRQAEGIAERALEAIPLDRRGVFLMHEIDGCGMPEIARVMEIPLNTAYSRLRLARADFFRAAAELSGHQGARK